RLDDVDQSALEQVPELGDGVHPFTGRDRDAGTGPYLAQLGRTVRWHRFLDPLRVVRLQQGGDPYRGRGREPAVHLDHELDVRAHRLADGRHDVDRQPALGRGQFGAGRPERVELPRPV